MNIIGSLAHYGMPSPLQRTRAEALDLRQSSEAALLAEQEKTRDTSSVSTGFKSEQADYSSQQAHDEAFARMLVNLNSIGSQPVQDSLQASDSALDGSSEQKPAADSALAQFMAYMEMTPAEKIRDKILKEVGMTEEELESLPPEQRAAVEKEIAEKMQTLQQLQAAQDEQGTLHEHA
ncbi:hypothetical protein [Phytopseudomonas daroniae]|uniref:hypothetical protein n=1 Tax=Phytopseudomonas daroniae TaxID=2487519 RepID=UPI0010382ED6|nr:hypothetical protein [Pseudomonas daroniae]TBU72140.1 hypothetical protein DNK10_21565 [Pseudomonas daroniae]